jgi:hypothetical protein
MFHHQHQEVTRISNVTFKLIRSQSSNTVSIILGTQEQNAHMDAENSSYQYVAVTEH